MGHRTRFLNLPYTDEAPINLAFDKIDAAIEGADSGGGGVPGAFSSATHDFTVAELFALDVTPVEMISAPGTGFVVLPIKVSIRTVGGAVSYDNGGLAFFYGSVSGETFINGSFPYPINTDDLLDVVTQNTITATAVGGFEDQPIVVLNDTSAPAMGDGTMSVTILYTVVPV